MKFLALFIAGVALAGCDITFGDDGPVVVQSDSILRQVVPIGTSTNGTAPNVVTDPTTPGATVLAPTVSGAAAAATPRAQATVRRTPITLSGITARTALPLGVTRAQVETFKAAVADEGCIIASAQQRAAVQRRTGFNDERLDRIIGYTWRDGDLDRNSGSYTLTSGRCSDA